MCAGWHAVRITTKRQRHRRRAGHVVERRYGSFGRQIPLGFTPDADAVEVVFADGVLKLTIAKPAEAKSDVRKIEIFKI